MACLSPRPSFPDRSSLSAIGRSLGRQTKDQGRRKAKLCYLGSQAVCLLAPMASFFLIVLELVALHLAKGNLEAGVGVNSDDKSANLPPFFL